VIAIERGPEPEILVQKKAEWLVAFLAKRAGNPRARPDPSKYGHPGIREALRRMSHGKCFYCESKPDDGIEVDHHLEVANEPSHAFTWENLYLACRRCNQAKKTKHVVIDGCIDPCALRELERACRVIAEKRATQGGRPLADEEREILRSFGQSERPFTLMLRVALQALEP
jgi:hypothetical protein